MTQQDAALVAELVGVIEDADREFGRLEGAVESILRWVPSGLTGAMIADWRATVGAWSRLRELLDTVADGIGSPGALRTWARSWNREVGGSVTAIAGRAEESQLGVPRYWEGVGAESYLASLPAQQRALDQIKDTISDPASTMLSEMADATDYFVTLVITILALLVSALIVAVALALTGVGAGGAITLAVTSIAASVTGVLAAYYELKGTASSNQSILHQQLNNEEGYPDGRWPRAMGGEP